MKRESESELLRLLAGKINYRLRHKIQIQEHLLHFLDSIKFRSKSLDFRFRMVRRFEVDFG